MTVRQVRMLDAVHDTVAVLVDRHHRELVELAVEVGLDRAVGKHDFGQPFGPHGHARERLGLAGGDMLFKKA